MSFHGPTAENPWNETAESRAAVLDDDEPSSARLADQFGADLGRVLKQQRGVIEFARVALPGLVDVCAAKTGQSYDLRALLYSAWNGKPVSVLDRLVRLDWALKRDVLTVLLAFGCEPGGGTPGFFYDAIADAFKRAGLFEWFTTEGELQAD